jgi:hypothetical protein
MLGQRHPGSFPLVAVGSVPCHVIGPHVNLSGFARAVR